MQDDVIFHLGAFLHGYGPGPRGAAAARVAFVARDALTVGCSELAARLLVRFGARIGDVVESGARVGAGEVLLTVSDAPPPAVQEAAGRLLAYACGIASRAADMVEAARRVNPHVRLCCRRKAPVRVRLAAGQSLAAGGFVPLPHRLENPVDLREVRAEAWPGGPRSVAALCEAFPDRAVFEIHDPAEVDEAVMVAADALILRHASPLDAWALRRRAFGRLPRLDIAAEGAVGLDDVAAHAASGIQYLITAAPLSAKARGIDIRSLP